MKLIGIEGCWRYPRTEVVWCCWKDGRFQLRRRIEFPVQNGTYKFLQRFPEQYHRAYRLQSPPRTGWYLKVDFDGILHREVWFVDELSMSRMAIRYFQTDYFDRKWIIRSIEVVLENVKW